LHIACSQFGGKIFYASHRIGVGSLAVE